MQSDTARFVRRVAPETNPYRSIQLLAWTALLVSLAIFIALVVFMPRGAGALLGLVQEARGSRAEVLEGTVLFQPPAAATWQQLASTTDLPEGTRIRTDDRSRVLITPHPQHQSE